MRHDPNEIDPIDSDGSPVADGDYGFEVQDGAVTGMVPLTTGGTVESIVAGANVTVDDTDPANPIVSATGGGGATIMDRRWNTGPGETSVDEFNDDTLDAAWVRVDGTGAASGNADWTEGADVLSALNKGGDTAAKFHALLRPLSGAGGSLANGDGFITCVDMFAATANAAFAGLVFTDGTTFGSGKQIWAEVGATTAGTTLQTYSWTTFGTVGSSAGAIGDLPRMKVFCRLALISANTWRADFSPDGVTWIKGTATVAQTMTATHVGFFSSSYGNATSHIASYEFIRRVSGVT